MLIYTAELTFLGREEIRRAIRISHATGRAPAHRAKIDKWEGATMSTEHGTEKEPLAAEKATAKPSKMTLASLMADVQRDFARQTGTSLTVARKGMAPLR
ncbi:hypothetical protein COV58_04205 [Candidatus Roizmanbacteria bacterium CG11_big_fil_rev_8_21_14_0_20_36_8]|uniref:Uncharacterized protein n=2 Tax=Patescibacteria group TaxID=1783273 RepID=A0A2M6ITB9_9BACT|nr:MAG: hypothetical protein COV58_04205 [Candidatus Roizmanbacteria bacterium CG11_big_fil_rev_8_21_14_0_20_36_8]PIR88149.1 MAG: hypothetical protein COU10_00795 [Candidatus Harrisonbacteria bacterium CG10_big_fil_rev_8_21_14_0_10_45_28]